jgi:hypothetical protein
MQTCGKTLQTTLLKQNHTTREQMFTYLQLMIAKENPRTGVKASIQIRTFMSLSFQSRLSLHMFEFKNVTSCKTRIGR